MIDYKYKTVYIYPKEKWKMEDNRWYVNNERFRDGLDSWSIETSKMSKYLGTVQKMIMLDDQWYIGSDLDYTWNENGFRDISIETEPEYFL